MILSFPSIEFDQAVAAVCHGSATEEQQHALNALLRSNPAARDEYILRVEIHSRLASDPDLFADTLAEASPTPEPAALPRPPARPAFSTPAWALALAACVALLLTGVWWMQRSDPATRKGDTSRAVAMLNRAAEAVWQEPGEAPRLGAPLDAGRLRIKSGLVQIVFYSGARVVVEGPAELELVSRNELVCHSGRLVAEVPPPAKGFRVRTLRMHVTDLGTVFGLDVTAHETGLHVFKGTVEFQVPGNAGTDLHSAREHQGFITDGTGPARQVAADEVRFASLFGLQNKSSEAAVLRHEQWRAASARLDEDPSLLVHLDFEPADPSDWRLINASHRTDAMRDAAIVGCQWTEGRWPDKHALEFRGVSDRVRLDAAGEHAALTLTAWVRVQGLDRQINSLFMSDGFEAGTVHWSIRQDGVLALTTIGSGPGNYQICVSPPVLGIDQFGLWMHLAVVIDGEGRRVAHYVNGVPAGEQSLLIPPPFRIGAAELGNWNARGFPRNDPFMIRNFSGAMDDFCVFGRALAGAEIRALYSAGRPQPDAERLGRH